MADMAEARYRCIWCGNTVTVRLPWQGRPQGPQCSCNPNSWGNWQRIPDGVTPPAGPLAQVVAGIAALDDGHDPLCMAVLRGKACTCGALGTGSAAGRTTAEFSSLRTQAHGYGVPGTHEGEQHG
jgi:hypothetical protein